MEKRKGIYHEEPEKKKKRCKICNAFLRSTNKKDHCDSHDEPFEKRGDDLPKKGNTATIMPR